MPKAKKRDKLTPIPKPKKAPAQRTTGTVPASEAAPDLSYIAPALRPLAVRTDDIELLAGNPLDHDDQEIEDMRAVLAARGQLVPLIINRRTTPPEVVGGNKRLRAMLADGREWVAVVDVDLPPDEAAALAIELNATQGQAWNKDALKKALERVGSLNLGEKRDAMMARLAEAQKLIPRMGGQADEGPKAEIDRAAELQMKWGTAPGQVWEIGRHRVHCGDCFEIDAEAADGVCTDPPYELKPELLQAAISRFAKCAAVLGTGKQIFHLCTNGWQHGIDFVWLHPSPCRGPAYGGGNAPLMYHVNVLVMALRGHKHGWSRPAPNTSSKHEADYEDAGGHGHGKPASLFEFILVGFPWRTVCDPFAGSMATLLACERLGKVFVGAEKDPEMLAVGLERCAELQPRLAE